MGRIGLLFPCPQSSPPFQNRSPMGSPPLTLDDWKNLPGVGPYIAAAVTSIALGQKQAVCDGNVVRALTRLFAISESFKDGSTAQKKIRPVAQALISGERPGDYNQAIMELGATICHRSSPLCSICPVLTHCKAGKSGEWMNYPALTPKPKKPQPCKDTGSRGTNISSFMHLKKTVSRTI